MVSRKNRVLTEFIAGALVLAYGGFLFTDVSWTVLIGILIFVGVAAPLILNNYFDNRESA